MDLKAEDIPASDEGTSFNGTDPNKPDMSYLFGAPDYASFIKRPETAKAKEYERKAASLIKVLMVGAIETGNWPDAATYIEKGPPLAKAAGQLADQNEKVAQALDMITTPSSPVAMFVMATAVLLSQISRNHEQQLSQVPDNWRARRAAKKRQKESGEQAQTEDKRKPIFTIRFLKWQIPIRGTRRIPIVRLIVRNLRAQTSDPGQIAHRVFSDPKVQKEITKQFGVVFNMDRTSE